MRVEGGRIAAAYHSHVDGPAVLSAVDVEQALQGDAPMHPGVDQVVSGTRGGKVSEIQAFRWREGAFRGAAVPLGS
jgi:proteasome lid subunit RPN8/RPN11